MSTKRKDRMVFYLLVNCAICGFAVCMVMGAYGVERRNEALPLFLTLCLTAAAVIPLIAVPVWRRRRSSRPT